MQINFTVLLLGCIASLNLWIGVYVYRRGPHAGQNRAFGFMAATTSLWTIAIALVHYGNAGHAWALRLAFASGSLIPLGVLAFIERLPVGPVDHVQLRNRVFSSIGLALCGLSFSPWI